MRGKIATTDDLVLFHHDCCQKALAIIRPKNRDYSSPGDPFSNFHRFGELGILVRMDDKMARLATIIQRGSITVADETIEDTALDLLNYSILLLGYLHNKKESK